MEKESNSIITKQFWKDLEFNRYGYSALLLVLQSCLGSIAVYFAFGLESINAQYVTISSISMSTMAANAAAIALAPMKWLLRLSAISIVISLICIMYASF